MPAPKGRLAPSPTGALHLGNARTFLAAWLSCRAQGGAVILRIEDLDHPKVKRETVAQALADLRWLGLDWDEGPDIGGNDAPYIQSQRLPLYRDALDKLLSQNLAYPCACTRKDVEDAASAPNLGDEGPRYPGTCRNKYASEAEAATARGDGRPPCFRFPAPERELSYHDLFRGPEARNAQQADGDFVIARGLSMPAYQLAVVVDDAAMGITEVVRGDDLVPSTFRQLLLYEALKLPAPAFAHLPLLVGPDGRRLAKRHGDTRISHIKAAGTTPEKVVGLLAHWSGWAEWGEEITPAKLLGRFKLSAIPKQPVVVAEKERVFLGLK